MANNISIIKNWSLKFFIIYLCAVALGISLLPLSAKASTLIFQNNVISVKTGETFQLPVNVSPGAEKNYTVRLALTFSPDILEVASFTFADNWISVPKPDYDLIDNQIGQLIKTAGYPAGISQNVPFGTITFLAKQAGQDVATIGIKSFILNAHNTSTLESRPRVLVMIIDKIVAEETRSQITPPTALEDLPVTEPPALFESEPPALFDVEVSVGQKESHKDNELFATFAIATLIVALAIIFITTIHEIKKYRVSKDRSEI